MSLLLTSLFLPRRSRCTWGAFIDERLKVHGVPIRWRTEITAWQPPHHFVDTQLSGPYWRWVHSHRVREVPGGSLVEDEVDFAVPGGWPIERLFVRRDLPGIFLHRQHPTPAPSASRPTCPPPCRTADL